ncbi:conserved hypothetical protein [Pediculus humanus corporis]|uniref:Cilia- and flagella-associated protein 206 n=1 Tax=Pediculus humanus subsp. corporis TaxID=121224 RepID=E0VJ53_PEDHC|nr:uncharacterized protein Phum_PHUM238740 [Pediculus humanus corporis]EEB13409.1 conserved hypothetical protein [Pediculus humanus corporis]
MDYNIERENNIITNIAKEIVKLKLLNPKNGFTASEVMPRSLTQQLVMLIVEELKQNTPAMNCLRMQVYWSTVNLNLTKLKTEYAELQTEKAESLLSEILLLDKEDTNALFKSLASYILVVQNLGSITHLSAMRETMAAIHSVFKNRHLIAFLNDSEEQKIVKIKDLCKKVTGIRLFLKSVNKAGEGIEDIKNLPMVIEEQKETILNMSDKIATRIEDIQYVIPNIINLDYLFKDVNDTADVNLPSDFDENDLKYLKQIYTIMLQHDIYIKSKIEEIDGDVSYYLNKFNEILERLQMTIQERDTIPVTEIYDDFTRAGEIWTQIYSYTYCLEAIQSVAKTLEDINSFNGFCAWTLFFAEGYLLPGSPSAGYYQYNDQYYAFATKSGQEMWSKDPNYYLIRIYEFLRLNTELVGLLNAYETLYNTKSLQTERKTGKKVVIRTENTQTILHPIPKHWDKDYTFSEWELKKRALTLSRLIKCVTKSVQTVNHSHFRSSIGLTAAPDKDKDVQTMRDSSCVHSTISAYLYGLRGHKENKFRTITLTRPVEEDCQRIIISQKSKSRTKNDEKKVSEEISDKLEPSKQDVLYTIDSKSFTESKKSILNSTEETLK